MNAKSTIANLGVPNMDKRVTANTITRIARAVAVLCACANPLKSAVCNFVYLPFGKTLIRVTAPEVPAWGRSL